MLVDGRRADVDALGLDVQLARQAEQLDQGLAGRGDRVAGTDRRLGLDVDDELSKLCALLDTGGLDLVGHLEDGAVDRVDRHAADLVVGALVLDGRDVAAATLDDELHLQLALVGQRGELSSGLWTSTPAGGAMSAAVTSPAPDLRRYIVTGSSGLGETTRLLRLRMISVTPSLTPSIVENSWRTVSTLMLVTEAPGMDDRRVRRSELPSV